MHTNHYDVVVHGNELTGLVAASLLARRGQRVLLCGHDQSPAVFNAAGYTLASDPGLMPSPDAPWVLRVLRELNQAPIVRRRAAPILPGIQVRLPRHRIEVFPDAEATRRALAPVFPDEGEAIVAALGRLEETSALLDPLLAADMTLPPSGFWDRREVARVESRLPRPGTDLLAGLPGGHPARVAVGAVSLLASGFGPGDLGPVPEARAYTFALRGVHRLDGGMPALRSLFLDRLQTCSGEVREKVTSVEVRWRRGRVAGLRLNPRDESVGLGDLVWAGSAASLLAQIGDKASRRLREIASGMRPACYRYALCLLVRPEALPADFGPRVLSVKDLDRPLMEHNLLAITVGARDARASDSLPLWVECLVPAAALSAGIGYLGLVRARVREHLRDALPQLEDHLIVAASPHDGLPPEVPDHTPPPGPVVACPAGAMPAVLSSDLPRTLEVGAAPHGTGLPNVYLASGENLPGLGRDGDFVSAFGLARLIAGSGAARRAARKKEIVILDG